MSAAFKWNFLPRFAASACIMANSSFFLARASCIHTAFQTLVDESSLRTIKTWPIFPPPLNEPVAYTGHLRCVSTRSRQQGGNEFDHFEASVSSARHSNPKPIHFAVLCRRAESLAQLKRKSDTQNLIRRLACPQVQNSRNHE